MSSEECISERFLGSKEQIFRPDAATAAIGGVNVPIRRANIVLRAESEGAGSAVNCPRCAFKFKEYTDGCFIQVDMETSKDERRAIFLISERTTEPERSQLCRPGLRIPDLDFPFELLFVAERAGPTRTGCNWDLRGEDRAGLSGADWRGRSGSLDPKPEKASAAAQVGIGRVKKRVPLEDASPRERA